MLGAFRKTEESKRVCVDRGYIQLGANLSNNCLSFSKNAYSEAWSETEYDHFDNGMVHARTKKMFFAEKLYAEQLYQVTKGQRLRKPTDIIVVTDGYCCSGCAIFTQNAKRTGSAIIAGYGGTYENDTLFASGQCFATTISTDGFCDDFINNSMYGLEFGVSFGEMYNISEKMDEIIPNDFDVPRIDFHLNYFEGAQPNFSEIISRTIKLHEESKTKCNPDNKNLIFISKDCKVSDPHALAVGYVCGDDGFWNKSSCKILTCQPMYSLDYVNNKCIPNICDGRSVLIPSSSSSSSSITSSSHTKGSSSSSSKSSSIFVTPVLSLIFAILFVLFFFTY